MKGRKYKKILSFTIVLVLSLVLALPNTVSAKTKISFCATVMLVSANSGSSSLSTAGHAFLVVKNCGNTTIKVGNMPVSVGNSITIGTYGNRSKHSGIWYNIEGYYSSSISGYGLVTGLTGSQLSTMNSTINSNDSWSLFDNCAGFACDVWNSIASSDYQVSGDTPTSLASSIKSKSGYTTNLNIPSKSQYSIAYHTSDSYIYDTSGMYSN